MIESLHHNSQNFKLKIFSGEIGILLFGFFKNGKYGTQFINQKKSKLFPFLLALYRASNGFVTKKKLRFESKPMF